jgi:hypothetical protein
MKHESYEEWIVLAALGELGAEDTLALDAHVAGCAECRAEREAVASFMSLAGRAGVTGPSDELLREARRALRESIVRETELAGQAAAFRERSLTQDGAWSTPGHSRYPSGAFRGWAARLTPGRAVLAGAGAMAVGLLAGYLLFGRALHGGAPVPAGDAARRTASKGEPLGRSAEMGAPSYRNIRVAGVDPRTNQVDLEYEVIRPARLRAGVEDERVQRVLAQAVMNEANPGTRLQAINTIGAYVARPIDEDVKQALIRAVRADPNAGVRKQALFVLYQMPLDEDIKQACLHVLAADENEGLRIAAVNMLSVAVLDGRIEGKEVMEAVGTRLQSDDNDYIRIQSGAFLQEVNGNGE